MDERYAKYTGELTRCIITLSRVYRRYNALHMTPGDECLQGPMNPVLLCILHHEGCSQEFIADHLCYDKATTAKIARKLEQAGCIRREIDNEDRRYYKIFLTDAGRGKAELIKRTHLEWSGKLLEGFSPAECAEIMRLLGRMSDNSRRN